MSRFKKWTLIVLLVINLVILAIDYEQVKLFMVRVDFRNDYIAFIYAQLLFFPNHFYLLFSIVLLWLFAIVLNGKRKIALAMLLKYSILFQMVFTIIACVISLVEQENFVVYLNIIIMDFLIGGMTFALLATHDYRIKFAENNYNNLKIVLLIVLFLLPILRVFGFGREIFLYLLKPSFFWGISGGLIMMITMFFILNPRDLDVNDEIIDRSLISIPMMIEGLTLILLLLNAHFSRIRSYEFLVIGLFVILIGKALSEARGLSKIVRIINLLYLFIIIVGCGLFYLLPSNNQQTNSLWLVICVEGLAILGIIINLCQNKGLKLNRNGSE